MADYYEQYWQGYSLKLRPSDWARASISKMPVLMDALPYFSASYIYLDLRLFIPRKHNEEWYSGILNLFPGIGRVEKGTIHYEWQLCNEDNTPIGTGKKNLIRFYNSEGSGDFEFDTNNIKIKRKDLEKVGYLVSSNQEGYWFRKRQAIDIGRLNKHTGYHILMQFEGSSSIKSAPMLLASFRLFDKEQFRMTVFLPVLISIIVSILTVLILKGFGLS
jgi:hypothetical protein